MRHLFRQIVAACTLGNPVTRTAQRQIRKCALIASLLVLPGVHVDCTCSLAGAQEIAGRYKLTGANIQYRITVPQQKPAAAIVIQYLPPQTLIQNATPAFSSYDPQTGIVKWLFSEVAPGILTISLQLAHPLERNEIKAEVLFKDHSGASSTFAIEPLPMKRRQLEGC